MPGASPSESEMKRRVLRTRDSHPAGLIRTNVSFIASPLTVDFLVICSVYEEFQIHKSRIPPYLVRVAIYLKKEKKSPRIQHQFVAWRFAKPVGVLLKDSASSFPISEVR